jgi:hypothetical protein
LQHQCVHRTRGVHRASFETKSWSMRIRKRTPGQGLFPEKRANVLVFLVKTKRAIQ